MAAANLVVAFFQHVVPRVEKQNFKRRVEGIERVRNGAGTAGKQALAAVYGDGGLLNGGVGVFAETNELFEHGGRQIIHAEIPLLLQTAEGEGLTCSRQAGNNQQIHGRTLLTTEL